MRIIQMNQHLQKNNINYYVIYSRMWDPESHDEDRRNDPIPVDNQDGTATSSSALRVGDGQGMIDASINGRLNGVMGSSAAVHSGLGGTWQQLGVRVKV